MNLTASFVLILLITISAFGVIFIKYQNRILNIEISENEKKHYYLSESYRQLLKDKADITDKVLQKYYFYMSKIFKIIGECESGRNIDRLLETPISVNTFKRLN